MSCCRVFRINNDVKKILWNASKLLNKVTKERWIISLSVRKGLKTVKEYEEEKWTRKFKNIKGNIVWREKYGSWTLNRQTLSLRVLRDDKKSDWTMYCKKSQI